jgi:hypothetical protein
MPDIYMDVGAAVVVPMNIMPLTDDTDFKSVETALVYDSAGLVVHWNFVTTAGVMTTTAITPTTAGVYDISEPLADVGMYAIELPASGGASVNNNATGTGWITGKATGILPWRGPTICFRAAVLNNEYIDTATPSTAQLADVQFYSDLQVEMLTATQNSVVALHDFDPATQGVSIRSAY